MQVRCSRYVHTLHKNTPVKMKEKQSLNLFENKNVFNVDPYHET